MQINISPDKKLFTKQILTMFVISFCLIIISIFFHLLLSQANTEKAAKIAEFIWPVCGIIIVLINIVSLPLLKLWINNLSYVMETDRIIIRKGIISKTEKSIPFSVITDFMLHQSLFDRILGIASIRIQTTGLISTLTGYDGTLDGLINYDEIYKVLRERLKNKLSFPVAEQNKLTDFSTPDLLTKILMELTAIRELLENQKKQ